MTSILHDPSYSLLVELKQEGWLYDNFVKEMLGYVLPYYWPVHKIVQASTMKKIVTPPCFDLPLTVQSDAWKMFHLS